MMNTIRHRKANLFDNVICLLSSAVHQSRTEVDLRTLLHHEQWDAVRPRKTTFPSYRLFCACNTFDLYFFASSFLIN